MITSRTNSAVKAVAALHKRAEREKAGLFIAEGLRTCHTLVEAGYAPREIYVTDGAHDDAAEAMQGQTLTLVADSVMQKMSDVVTPSGVLGVFLMPPSPALDQLGPGLVLAEVSDPGNMGMLIRSAAAVGASSVVVVGGCDPWSPKVVRASVGTIGYVQLFLHTWDEFIKSAGSLPVYALVSREGIPPKKVQLRKGLIVVGNEAHGIPQAWIDQCSQKVTLAMPGGTESLNAAVAGSIALYLAYADLDSL